MNNVWEYPGYVLMNCTNAHQGKDVGSSSNEKVARTLTNLTEVLVILLNPSRKMQVYIIN
jgi:hypothetical protein